MPPPKPIACAMPAIGPRLPEPMAFIMSAMFRCIFSSLLTSWTSRPAPAAMRFLRLALRMSGFLRSCRVIESITATWRLMILSSMPAVGDLVLHLGDAGHHAHQAADAAHIRHLQQLLAHVGEVELALAHPLGGACGLFGVDIRRGSLDQRHHVAHAEDAAGNAARVKIFQRVGLFAGADQLDRLAGHRAHRQRGAAAAVAVHPRQHDAGEANALIERAREVDRVLAGQRIRDQQHFMRIGGGFDFRGLAHHLFVERGAAGGIEQHHVVAAELACFQRAARDLRRLLAGHDRQRRNVEIAPQHGQLLHRRRAVDVERGHQHLALVALGHAAGEFRGGGGFAGALKSDHHDRDRRHRIEIDGLAVGTERGDQFVMDDLDHHLAGRDRLDDGGADRLLADAIGEASDNVERDVGFQQRAAHLAHRGVDIGFRQRTAARQPIEYPTKLFRQIVEQCRCPVAALAGAALRSVPSSSPPVEGWR